jgi:hypothetical protein
MQNTTLQNRDDELAKRVGVIVSAASDGLLVLFPAGCVIAPLSFPVPICCRMLAERRRGAVQTPPVHLADARQLREAATEVRKRSAACKRRLERPMRRLRAGAPRLKQNANATESTLACIRTDADQFGWSRAGRLTAALLVKGPLCGGRAKQAIHRR